MEFFRVMGERLSQEWEARDWDTLAFPELAVAALSAHPPADNVSLLDVVEWVHSGARLGVQGDPHHRFGDPDVRVFESERFYIEVLFWVDGTTSIHQHGFSGAFHVMGGSSLHTRYTFERERRFNEHLLSGKLAFQDVEVLGKGATRPIHAASGLIHSLFHLDRPSISVVVRTHGEAASGPQYRYLRSSLAYDPYFSTPTMRKRRETLHLLYKIKHPRFEEIARESVRSADSLTAFHLLQDLMDRVRPYTAFRALVESMRTPRNTALLDMVLEVEEEERRENNIILRREQIQSAEHRFLLALLLNVPRREQILGLVRTAFPARDPVEAIVGWTRELSETKLAGSDESLIGISFGDSEMDVMRHLLSGATDAQVLERMETEYSAAEVEENRDDVLALCDAFRHSLLFKPLFAR